MDTADIKKVAADLNKMADTQVDYLFDDYFDDPEDPGIAIQVEHRGRVIPFTVRRSLPLGDRQKANAASIEIGMDETGTPFLKKMDQGAFTKEIVLAGLKSWPFKYGPTSNVPPSLRGQPVAITRENIDKLDGGLLDKLAGFILGTRSVQENLLDPFVQR